MTDFSNLRINSERLRADFDELAEIGATVDGGVNRLALSKEDLQARSWLANRFDASGLVVRDDDAGNLSGVLLSDNPDARTLLLGSHLDSVPDGGRYDTSVGVLAQLECVRTIKEAGIKLPVHLEAIDFTDEEGCWQSFFGSRALTGTLPHNYISDAEHDYGPFRAALFRAGIRPADIYKARRDPATIAGYLELHIEQGSRLDRAQMDMGIVTNIVGRMTYEMTFSGQTAYSGTTPSENRRDALLGASAYVVTAYGLMGELYPQGVLNCGNLEVAPGVYNMIPAEARLTMEFRHFDRNELAEMEHSLLQQAEEQAAEYNLALNTRRTIHIPAAMMAGRTVLAAEQVCQELGVTSMRMTSYAGHDAQIMSQFTPSGMIFVPSVDGISHSPKEFTEWRHVEHGANVLMHTAIQLAQDTA